MDVATRIRSDNETTPSFLMENVYKIPHDYSKPKETPFTQTLQDFLETSAYETMIRNAELNSLKFYD